jgi:hypothetical protein
MPYWVPLKVQLLTEMLLTPPDVWLPMESPCPVPKVHPVIVIPAATAEDPPMAITSSPSLILQFSMLMLVPVTSMPSVLGEMLDALE